MTFQLGQPYALLLLLALVPLLLWRVRSRGKEQGSLRFSSIALARMLPVSRRQRFSYIVDVMRVITLFLLVAALARPNISRASNETPTEGVDIVLALDLSYSMSAADMGNKNNRLEAAKEVIQGFVGGRNGDRIGLVGFASEGVTISPLTLDYPILLQLLSEAGFGRLPEGTSVGQGLATSVNLLREGQGKNRTVILLTDGQSNAGDISPEAAAEMAQLLNIRVYTVGVGGGGAGTGGSTRRTITDSVDEKTLRHIAETTGGSYFRALDQDALQEIYKLIAQLEKSSSGQQKYVELLDLRGPFLLISCLLLLLEIGGRTLGFRRIP